MSEKKKTEMDIVFVNWLEIAKKAKKMPVTGPICAFRAACAPGSAQKSSVLTSQTDSMA